MACPKIALTMLVLGSVMVLGTDARAQADAPRPARLAGCGKNRHRRALIEVARAVALELAVR
jgi:hypothetical protein